jgi:SAM-dependent methyltransferase
MNNQMLSLRQIMNRVYKDICGFEIPKTDESTVKLSKGSPVYGEINHQSLTTLLGNLKLCADDVFYDLGSGVGKAVLHTALITPVKKAIGIELSKTRHEESLQALANAEILAPSISQRCVFINDDLLNVDLSKATIIYTCSTAFSLAFMKAVVNHLSKLSQNFRLITLQELPINGPFKLVDKIRLDMSWVRKTPVYTYQR